MTKILDLQSTVNCDVALLFKAASTSPIPDWSALRSYFAFWSSPDELICKVIAWGRLFLPTYLRDPTPPFHYELLSRIFSDQNEYTACPRGFAKTTLNQLAICFKVAYRLENFIVVIEKNFTEASEVIGVVRNVFSNDTLIRQVYGDLVKHDEAGQFDDKNKDAQGDIFVNGVRLRAKGFNAPIRGLKSAEWRPSLILVDDVEEDLHIGSFEQRKKYRENYAQGIVPALDVQGRVKVVGTILHFDSLLKNLIDQFHGKIFRAFDPLSSDPASTVLWPERWPYELLMERKEQMMIEGLGERKFYQEFLNEPLDDENRAFKLEWLQKTYQMTDTERLVLNRYIAIDVAESKNKSSDFTGVVIVDWDSENNWYVEFVRRYKVNSAELVSLIFELWHRFKPIKIGVEKRAFEDQVKPLLRTRSSETDIYPVVVELEHHGKRKEDRVKGALQGRFENGKIFWKVSPTDETLVCKGELMDFPVGKHDDLVDALAYIQDLGARPFKKKRDVQSTSEQEFYAYRKEQRKNKSVATQL